MKNGVILLFSVLALAACSQSKTTDSSSTVTVYSSETTTTSTTVVPSSSAQQTSSEYQEKAEDPALSYAVNLADFTQEITLSDGTKQTVNHLTFKSKQKNQPTTITLDIKDLNNYGKALYLTTTGGDEVFYPVAIADEPTKRITVTNDAGAKRDIKVNTVVRVAALEDSSDPMEIVGDTYFLFYNDQGTISLATRNFSENTAGTPLDTTNLVEYLPGDATAETPSSTPVADYPDSETYYDAIRAAWQQQQDYIDSIDDDAVKQSVQTSHSAAIFEANRLEMEHPEDADLINESLQKVLSGK